LGRLWLGQANQLFLGEYLLSAYYSCAGAPTSRSLAGGMDAPPARERFAGPAHYIFYFFLFPFCFFNYEQFQILNLIFSNLNKFCI
jgi:hypothetical protein